MLRIGYHACVLCCVLKRIHFSYSTVILDSILPFAEMLCFSDHCVSGQFPVRYFCSTSTMNITTRTAPKP